MRITRHRYKVKPEYVAQNKRNLDEFIAALTAASVRGLCYRVFLEEDGQTFLHLVTSQDDPSAVITGLPSFKKFQSELLASDPIVRPDQVGMSLVATSGDSYR
jgi:L-rhamnose mutarotase